MSPNLKAVNLKTWTWSGSVGNRKKLKVRELTRILASYGVVADTSRGKGGHIMYIGEVDGQRASYPVPSGKEVLDCYVNGARRRFALTPADGISDDEFYSRS